MLVLVLNLKLPLRIPLYFSNGCDLEVA